MGILYEPDCSKQEFFIAAAQASVISLGSTAGTLFAVNLKRRATEIEDRETEDQKIPDQDSL